MWIGMKTTNAARPQIGMKMKAQQLYESKEIAVERYGGGWILADYSGRRGEASYCGKSKNWRRQPAVPDPFDTEEDAIKAAADTDQPHPDRDGTDMATLTQPIKWHGGKHYLADWIVSHFPPHTHYVEPYAGGLSVLLRKDPEGVSEVVNDLNGPLAAFWTVLADARLLDEFVRRVEATPFSEFGFETAGLVDRNWTMMDIAVRFFIRARQSRQGLMKDFATLSRNRTRRGMNEQVSSWLTAIDGLPDVHARLKRVVVLNRPAVEVIRQQDGPNTLFYLDPPYLHETRVTTSDYAHEMTRDQHEELLDAITGIQGKFALSGYPSELYREWAKGAGWRCETREIDNKASSKKTKGTKIECLWMNYERTNQ